MSWVIGIGNGLIWRRGGGAAAPDGNPSGLTATAITSTRIDLAWTIGSTNHDGHSIERSADGLTGWAEIATVTGATATYSNTGLTGNHFYYRVRTYKGSAYSDYCTAASNLVPLCIYDGTTIVWYDYSDISTITKDGANLVSKFADKLSSGNDLIQNTDTNKPLYNSTDGIIFNGSDNFMITADFNLQWPVMVYACCKLNAYQNYDFIISGFVNNIMILGQITNNTTLRWGGINNTYILGNYMVIRGLGKSGTNNSFLKIDANSVVGTVIVTTQPEGIVMGANYNNTDYFINMNMKELILRREDTSTNESAIYEYVKKKVT